MVIVNCPSPVFLRGLDESDSRLNQITSGSFLAVEHRDSDKTDGTTCEADCAACKSVRCCGG